LKNVVAIPGEVWYVLLLAKEGQRMNDYMTALLERFRIETPELSEYQARTRAAEDKLRETLDDGQRRLLLRLADCENYYRTEAALCGFLSGWRLANGIRDAQDALPRFSLLDEDEARVLKAYESERRNGNA
jgi:hypothetical protein